MRLKTRSQEHFHRKILVAEKIEDQDTYLKARKMGFQLFRGYFFSRPKIVAGLKSKKSGKAIYQHLLSELHSEEPSFHRLASIIEKDRVVKIGGNNKARDNSIRSMHTVMGLTELERWVSVLMILDLSADKPQELIRLSLPEIAVWRAHCAAQQSEEPSP